MRCSGIEALADFLEDRMTFAALANQHDVVLVIGNVVLLGGTVENLHVRGKDGGERDIDTLHGAIQLKTEHDVNVDDVPTFVRMYYSEMVKEKARNRTWWLCFFMKRRVPKGKLGETCMYYMFLIQVPTARLTRDMGDRDEIESEAKAP